jgi:hypothetical protein
MGVVQKKKLVYKYSIRFRHNTKKSFVINHFIFRNLCRQKKTISQDDMYYRNF